MSRRAHKKRLKKTGQPEMLPVTGEAGIVVQNADQLDDREAIKGIKEALRQADRSEGISLRDFDRKMRRKYKIPKAS